MSGSEGGNRQENEKKPGLKSSDVVIYTSCCDIVCEMHAITYQQLEDSMRLTLTLKVSQCFNCCSLY